MAPSGKHNGKQVRKRTGRGRQAGTEGTRRGMLAVEKGRFLSFDFATKTPAEVNLTYNPGQKLPALTSRSITLMIGLP